MKSTDDFGMVDSTDETAWSITPKGRVDMDYCQTAITDVYRWTTRCCALGGEETELARVTGIEAM